MVNCGACGKFLSSVGAASCALCPLKYHKACLVISDKTNISRDWACPNCKRNIRRGDNSRGEEALHNKELAQFMAEMREFRKEMVQLRDALSARLDTIERRLDELEQRQPEAGSVTVLAARLGVTLEERDVAEGRIFINERLTRHNRQLFHLACEECRRLQWKYTWTRRGRILVRKAEGSSVYQLRSKSDVERVLGPRQS
ncbi:hypothetical protein ACJJTC_015001 [Scirpophaga incertulas]